MDFRDASELTITILDPVTAETVTISGRVSKWESTAIAHAAGEVGVVEYPGELPGVIEVPYKGGRLTIKTVVFPEDKNKSSRKPILCVDFDGVLHSYSSGWHGACEIPDEPVPGALRWLLRASEFWDVQVYSSRTKDPGARAAMRDWLRKWAIVEFWPPPDWGWLDREFMPLIKFPDQKPAAALTIDDRAVCFEGDWNKLDPGALLDFKPWNKR